MGRFRKLIIIYSKIVINMKKMHRNHKIIILNLLLTLVLTGIIPTIIFYEKDGQSAGNDLKFMQNPISANLSTPINTLNFFTNESQSPRPHSSNSSISWITSFRMVYGKEWNCFKRNHVLHRH